VYIPSRFQDRFLVVFCVENTHRSISALLIGTTLMILNDRSWGRMDKFRRASFPAFDRGFALDKRSKESVNGKYSAFN
jgi:hypothetical protein